MSASTEEHLDRAVRHVSDGWLPPQQHVLERVQKRLEQGDYEHDRALLAEDLKEDFALYMYCLRELTAMLDESSGERTGGWTPVDVLRESSIEDVRLVLACTGREISKHSLDEMNEYQATRIKETMLSASAAEVLSRCVDLDPDVGFSCGLLRQLGLTLIAWNYPRVYARAVQKLSPETSLDHLLKQVLGFTPALLGLTFARKWNMSEEILAAVGGSRPQASASNAFARAAKDPKDKEKESLQLDSVGATLAKICEIGEALARANHPEHYPTALHDWENAHEMIASQLGPDGVREIYQRAEEHLKTYTSCNPELLEFTDSEVIKERIIDSQYAIRLLEKNLYLKTLPEEIRAEIKKIYTRFKPNKILKSNIELIVHQLIPKAGFVRGCIFMYEPDKRCLAPAIKIGWLSEQRAKPVKIGSVLSQFDIVASAYSLKTPLREENARETSGRTTTIAAALGTVHRAGVLYLETEDDYHERIGTDPMMVFRAVRQCLCDCLNLS